MLVRVSVHRTQVEQGTLRGLARYRPVHLRARFDDKDWEDLPGVTVLAVGNGQFFGGGMKVCPLASPSSGTLSVTIWQGVGLMDFVYHGKKIYDGTHTELPYTRIVECTTLEVEVIPKDTEVFLEADGESIGHLEASWGVTPRAITLVV